MESIAQAAPHVSVQIAALVGMMRPDHPAFGHLAAAAPNARFTIIFQNQRHDEAAIRNRVTHNLDVSALMASGQMTRTEGRCSPDSDDNQSFLVQVAGADGTTLVVQKFTADTSPEASVYGTLFAGNAQARVAIAERFLRLLDTANAAYKAANARLVEMANATF